MNWDVSLITAAMLAHGATQILVKELAPNDNSKNQVYLAGSLDILNVIPMGAICSETTPKGLSILKAAIDFSWLLEGGGLSPAPHAQLILYPQYPEVRFSGFLRGASNAPNRLMASREPGRILFLGITPRGKVIGWAGEAEPLRLQIEACSELTPVGAFRHLQFSSEADAETRLISRLAEICSEGWIEAQRLYGDGLIGPCRGGNCGGYTLEAKLGVIPNGRSEPDVEGWEVKGHAVGSFRNVGVGQLTLMTPEPTGGLYKSEGPDAFVRGFGYPDPAIPDRLNFSSPHRFGQPNVRTGLTLDLVGGDPETGKINDANGAIILRSADDRIAAEWSFAKLLEHWARKHERAVYVPYLLQSGLPPSYHYGDTVRLGRGTDFFRFLAAMGSGAVWYDPGLKIEAAGSAAPRLKRRNQFRIRSAHLPHLYRHFDDVSLF